MPQRRKSPSEQVRVARAFKQYLERRATRVGVSVVELTRRMHRTITARQKRKEIVQG